MDEFYVGQDYALAQLLQYSRESSLKITDRGVLSVSLGSIYLFSLTLMIQSQSSVFLEMGKELSSCTGYSELMYKFSKGLRSCGFR